MANDRPSEQDRIEAIRRLLEGLTNGDDATEIAASTADLHPTRDTFPGEVFLELAADVREVAQIERSNAIRLEDLCRRLLPEVEFRGKENR
ncbi:MAG: hypothetical protein GY745_19335 [Actinomycetia bacterium]|nr:hypothetical protein [Actinomycetes bacterium]